MLIKDVMTKEVILGEIPGTRDQLMKIFSKGVRIIPIKNKKNGKFVGIISQLDLINKPEEDEITLLINKNPITTTPDSNLNEVVGLFINKEDPMP